MLSIGIGIGYWGTWYSCLQLEPPVVIEGAIRFLAVAVQDICLKFLTLQSSPLPRHMMEKSLQETSLPISRERAGKLTSPYSKWKQEPCLVYLLIEHIGCSLFFYFFYGFQPPLAPWLPQSRPESVGLQHMPQLCLRSCGLNPPRPSKLWKMKTWCEEHSK